VHADLGLQSCTVAPIPSDNFSAFATTCSITWLQAQVSYILINIFQGFLRSVSLSGSLNLKSNDYLIILSYCFKQKTFYNNIPLSLQLQCVIYSACTNFIKRLLHPSYQDFPMSCPGPSLFPGISRSGNF